MLIFIACLIMCLFVEIRCSKPPDVSTGYWWSDQIPFFSGTTVQYYCKIGYVDKVTFFAI